MNRTGTEVDYITERFEELADEFSRRIRSGESPNIESFVDENPDLEEKIRRLFPVLEMMEADGSSPDDWSSVDSIESVLADYACSLEGTTIGDFEILNEIGRGGMGIVYLANQKSLNRKVALKLLPDSVQFDQRRRARFQREARASAMLHHTNIVPVFYVGQHKKIAYFAMQYIDGQPLNAVLSEASRIKGKVHDAPTEKTVMGGISTAAEHLLGISSATDAKTVPSANLEKIPEPVNDPMREAVVTGIVNSGNRWKRIAQFGVQVAQALEHAHSKGIMHRDIKPSNLLLNAQGEVWVTDFGLAKSFESPEITRTGEIVGTLRYMSPEQLNGTSDVRSEVFALGLTLYEMLVLQPAYDAEKREALLKQVVEAKVKSIQAIEPNVPRDLATIVHKCLRVMPDRRYQTAAEVSDDLSRYLKGEPIEARRIGLVGKFVKWCKRQPVVAALAGCLFLSLVTGILGVSYQWKKTSQALTLSQQNATEAQRQSELALTALSDVVGDIASVLHSTNGTVTKEMGAAQKKIVQDVYRGLGRVSENLKQREKFSKTLIWTHLDLGDVYVRIGDEGYKNATGRAAKEFNRAFELGSQWIESEPDNLDAHHILSEVYQKIATYHFSQYAFEESLSNARNAIDIAERVIAASEGKRRFNAMCRRCKVLGLVSRVEFRRFNLPAAIEVFLDTIDAISQLELEFPDRSDDYIYKFMLPETERSLVICQNLPQVREDIESAFQLGVKAEYIPRMLYDCAAWQAFDGDHLSAAKTLKRLEQMDDLSFRIHYSIACGYARCAKALVESAEGEKASALSKSDQELFLNYANSAVRFLEICESTEMFEDASNIGLIGRDPDLDVIRDNEGFQKFFSRLAGE